MRTEGSPHAEDHLRTTSLLVARLTEERDIARERADAGWTEAAALRQERDQLRKAVEEFLNSRLESSGDVVVAKATLASALRQEARAEIAERRNMLNPEATEYVEQLEAELERYREALERIVDEDYGVLNAAQFARQALQEQGDG